MKTIKMLMMAAFSILTVTVFSQSKLGKTDTMRNTVLYSCTMHPDVSSSKEGKCPTCGMKLELSKKEQMKRAVTNNYTCPVHAAVLTKNPGKCPECGMDLKLSPKEKMNVNMRTNFTCPMHADVVRDKDGKCPKCGMNLTKVKIKSKSSN